MQSYVFADGEALLHFVDNTTTIADGDEIHSDAPTQIWGPREWLICGAFLLVLIMCAIARNACLIISIIRTNHAISHSTPAA